MKKIAVLLACGVATFANADTRAFAGFVTDAPSVVREAEAREAKRQDSTWTVENIQQNPYLFLQDQISQCDKLKVRVEAQKITLVRMEKEAQRKAEEGKTFVARYEKFLNEAKAAYKAAPAENKFPLKIGDYELEEEDFKENCADALERIEIARQDIKEGSVIVKKVAVRKDVLKKKLKELASLRSKIVRQAEQVKMNAALAEIDEMKTMMSTIQDMRLEIDADPAKFSLDDLTAEDPNARRNQKVNSFLED